MTNDRDILDIDDTPILDADDDVISELELDRVDDVAERLQAIVDLAAGLRQWRFGHVIVDEAQDLTPMQWRMVTRRAMGGSMTLVGDLAQRSAGPAESWRSLLPEEIDVFTQRELTVNYRSPAEVNDVAAAVLATMPTEVSPSVAIRSSGRPVEVVVRPDGDWSSALRDLVGRRGDDGRRVAVVHADGMVIQTDLDVDVLSATESKGLEFDDVVVIEPAAFTDVGSLYVALTRATQSLTIVHRSPLPAALAAAVEPG